MNESIKSLLAVQERDLELDKLRAEVTAIPGKITGLKKQIQDSKTAFENSKKELTQFQLSKKQLDLDLDQQESAIRKHSNELNAVKTNDAYRALMGEIDKAKRDKSTLEDQILQVMEQIDQAAKTWKEREAAAKGMEGEFQTQIADLENTQKMLEAQISDKSVVRDHSLSELPKALADQYQRLRDNKHSAVIVPIRNEQCGGCHMTVSQNLINETRRGQKILVCESCSRIVYLEEVPVTPPV